MRKSDVTKVRTGRNLRGYLTSTALVAALMSQSVAANVLTAPLNWQSMSIEMGLDRLKAQFLDLSVREDTEFVGAVLRTPEGTYEFTHGHGKPGQDRVSFRIQRPADAEIVGLWHTHGAHGAARAVFSPTDARLVRETGLPFYLITPEGEVRVLRPEHVEGRGAGGRIKGTMFRLPRGSHPGERVSGRSHKYQAPRGCADVIEV